VVTQAVGLDHEAELRPEEVDAEAVDPLLRERRRQTSGTRDRQKSPLELGLGEPERAAVEEPTEGRQAAPPRITLERQAERLGIDEIAAIGLVDCCLELRRVEACRQIDQRADRRRHRDSVSLGDLLRAELGRPVDADAGPGDMALLRHGDVDRAADRRHDLPDRTGTHVAAHRARAAGEHRGHPAPAVSQGRAPERVDAAPYGMEASAHTSDHRRFF